jgi:hypothetical protein
MIIIYDIVFDRWAHTSAFSMIVCDACVSIFNNDRLRHMRQLFSMMIVCDYSPHVNICSANIPTTPSFQNITGSSIVNLLSWNSDKPSCRNIIQDWWLCFVVSSCSRITVEEGSRSSTEHYSNYEVMLWWLCVHIQSFVNNR